jgi:chorismate mutase
VNRATPFIVAPPDLSSPLFGSKSNYSPDEHPFTPNLPGPLLPHLKLPEILHQPANKIINVNPSILSFYTRAIVPLITRRATKEFAQYRRAKGRNGGEEFEDDENYGSAAIADVAVLQVISKRIHYGEPPSIGR